MATHKNTTDHSGFATSGCFRPPCSCRHVAVTSAWQAVRHLWNKHEDESTDVFPNDPLPMACLEPGEGFAMLDAMRSHPWLWSKASLPCKCKHLVAPNALLVIQHIYDEHVQQRGDWDMEGLQEFVDKVTERWLRTSLAAPGWLLARPDERPNRDRICHACGDPLPADTPRGKDCKKCRGKQKHGVN